MILLGEYDAIILKVIFAFPGMIKVKENFIILQNPSQYKIQQPKHPHGKQIQIMKKAKKKKALFCYRSKKKKNKNIQEDNITQFHYHTLGY